MPLSSKCLFQLSSVEELPKFDRNRLSQVMNEYSMAAIRGLVSPEQVAEALKKIKAGFRPEKDLPPQGVDPAIVQTNCQKLTITGAIVRNNGTPRAVRTFFNPIWAEDVYGMRPIFEKMAAVRNYLTDQPMRFATDKIENGVWTAARVHHYPKGGGFFAAHTDWVTEDVANQNGLPFYQLVLVMSKKGKDFQHGGGFVDLNGKRRYIEQEFEVGDVAIYDGRTQHGVEDIDPFDRFDSHSSDGRYAAFVTLFKEMKSVDEVNALKWSS